MSAVTIVADFGSCHNQKLNYLKEYVNIAHDIGIDVIKGQLFPDIGKYTDHGNIPLSKALFGDVYEYGLSKNVKVTASVFSEELLDYLLTFDVPFIKLAYSQRKQFTWVKKILDKHKQLCVSCDFMETMSYPDTEIKLFCISEYPVTHRISFEGLFPPFDGFSDHTLGHSQTIQAVVMGADVIEKHITLGYADIRCPDSRFALKPRQFTEMVSDIRGKL